MVANAVLSSVRWCPTSRASQLIGLATTAGLPWAVAPIIWLNPVVNMDGWYCSTASSSQIPARPSCSQPPRVRCLPACRPRRATAGRPGRSAPRRGAFCHGGFLPGSCLQPWRRDGLRALWMPRSRISLRPEWQAALAKFQLCCCGFTPADCAREPSCRGWSPTAHRSERSLEYPGCLCKHGYAGNASFAGDSAVTSVVLSAAAVMPRTRTGYSDNRGGVFDKPRRGICGRGKGHVPAGPAETAEPGSTLTRGSGAGGC